MKQQAMRQGALFFSMGKGVPRKNTNLNITVTYYQMAFLFPKAVTKNNVNSNVQ